MVLILLSLTYQNIQNINCCFVFYSSPANPGIFVGSIVFLFVASVLLNGGGPKDEKDAVTFGMDLAQSPFDVSRSWHGAFYGNLLLGKFTADPLS